MAKGRYCRHQNEFEKNKCCVFNDVPIADSIKYRLEIPLRLKGIPVTFINFEYL